MKIYICILALLLSGCAKQTGVDKELLASDCKAEVVEIRRLIDENAHLRRENAKLQEFLNGHFRLLPDRPSDEELMNGGS
jgi:regulator of replication initiation timing